MAAKMSKAPEPQVVAAEVAVQDPFTPPAPRIYKDFSDYSTYSIRQLKQIASEQKVLRYGNMTKAELIQALTNN